MSMSPSIYEQANSGEDFFSFRKSEQEKYNQFSPNRIEKEEYVDLQKIRNLLEDQGIKVNCGFSLYDDHVRYHLDDGYDIIHYSEIPDCIFNEDTYYLSGNYKGHLEPSSKYKKWIYENDLEIVYIKDAKRFFPKNHFIHELNDNLIVVNNY